MSVAFVGCIARKVPRQLLQLTLCLLACQNLWTKDTLNSINNRNLLHLCAGSNGGKHERRTTSAGSCNQIERFFASNPTSVYVWAHAMTNDEWMNCSEDWQNVAEASITIRGALSDRLALKRLLVSLFWSTNMLCSVHLLKEMTERQTDRQVDLKQWNSLGTKWFAIFLSCRHLFYTKMFRNPRQSLEQLSPSLLRLFILPEVIWCLKYCITPDLVRLNRRPFSLIALQSAPHRCAHSYVNIETFKADRSAGCEMERKLLRFWTLLFSTN